MSELLRVIVSTPPPSARELNPDVPPELEAVCAKALSQKSYARYETAADLPTLSNGQGVCVAGLVITKQRPGTASGVTFVTLEDETGHVNLIVWKAIAERQRAAFLNARLMGVRGELQIEGQVIHVIARELVDNSEMLGTLSVRSRDFR